MALARALVDRGDRDAVRRLAGFLAEAGEDGAAMDLKIALGKAVWATHREALQDISNTMRPAGPRTPQRAPRAPPPRSPQGPPPPDPGGQPLPPAPARYAALVHRTHG